MTTVLTKQQKESIEKLLEDLNLKSSKDNISKIEKNNNDNIIIINLNAPQEFKENYFERNKLSTSLRRYIEGFSCRKECPFPIEHCESIYEANSPFRAATDCPTHQTIMKRKGICPFGEWVKCNINSLGNCLYHKKDNLGITYITSCLIPLELNIMKVTIENV